MWQVCVWWREEAGGGGRGGKAAGSFYWLTIARSREIKALTFRFNQQLLSTFFAFLWVPIGSKHCWLRMISRSCTPCKAHPRKFSHRCHLLATAATKQLPQLVVELWKTSCCLLDIDKAILQNKPNLENTRAKKFSCWPGDMKRTGWRVLHFYTRPPRCWYVHSA